VDLDQIMIVAGVGCRKGTQAAEIEAAIEAAFASVGVAVSELSLIATSAGKGGEPGIAAAASSIGVPLVLIPQGELTPAAARATTRSERVIALMGVPSIAEAAALAAAGPAAQLIVPRIVVGRVTCALADGEAFAHDATVPSSGPSSPETAP
jgi:cobalt-precorrin 5A hydrolase